MATVTLGQAGGGNRLLLGLTALSGLSAVAAGAFAAHGLALQAAKEWMRTGSTYELIHSAAALACLALAPRSRWPVILFLIGNLLFSGSLYAMALGAVPSLVGAATPIGGLAYLAGWLALAITAFWPARPHHSEG
jgi:uncharacterized membrane protein YgdD (TMEM256/DUF423 family)